MLKKFNYYDDTPFTSDILEELRNYDYLNICSMKFNHSIDDIPDNIMDISITRIGIFNHPIHKYPKKLKMIFFNHNFNQPIINLPPNIETICFGDNFNQPLENLTENINFLTFGKKFNQPVDNLPPKIKILIFGENFNQSVDNLPPELEILEFGDNFNQNIDNIPLSIKKIILGQNFNQKLYNLPPNLNDFTLDSTSYTHSLDYIPPTIKYFKLFTNLALEHVIFNISKLPRDIVQITISKYYKNDNIKKIVENFNEENKKKMNYRRCIYKEIDTTMF